MKDIANICAVSLVLNGLSCKSRDLASSPNQLSLSIKSSQPALLVGPEFLKLVATVETKLDFDSLQNGYGNFTHFLWFSEKKIDRKGLKANILRDAEAILDRDMKDYEAYKVAPYDSNQEPRLHFNEALNNYVSQNKENGCAIYFDDGDKDEQVRYFIARETVLVFSSAVIDFSKPNGKKISLQIASDGNSGFVSQSLNSKKYTVFGGSPDIDMNKDQSYTLVNQATGPVMFMNLAEERHSKLRTVS